MNKVIGIDIGGTMIKGGIVEEKIIKTRIIQPLAKKQPMESLDSVIKKLLRAGYEQIKCIGIATAGRVDSDDGVVLYASPNIPNWSSLQLSKILRKRYDIPCYVINDAKAAALAEAKIRNVSNLVLLTIGTGLGGGIIVNGEILQGFKWEAGEIGHTILHPNGRQCNCGKKGCAEQYISMKVLHRYAKERDRHRLIERFHQNDLQIVSAVERLVKDLVILTDKLFLTIDPEFVVIGGGFCELGSNVLEIIRKHLEPYASKSLYSPSQVDLSTLGNDAGIIGAAMYAESRISGG
ncbi:ROK family protein [Pseudothermotoga thermarum]|uniref:ROK family protein n=1 Tax=Pseudothermotoga thermarum DSM 5069 TaxID=688269 RepID=F7YVC5_9THEM|nr:ROK family protein [Pseudothermotoga thermarum]AEH50428.1 ROK family protein [Pseudothermotoga thermarum DSM 5069]